MFSVTGTLFRSLMDIFYGFYILRWELTLRMCSSVLGRVFSGGGAVLWYVVILNNDTNTKLNSQNETDCQSEAQSDLRSAEKITGHEFYLVLLD